MQDREKAELDERARRDARAYAEVAEWLATPKKSETVRLHETSLQEPTSQTGTGHALWKVARYCNWLMKKVPPHMRLNGHCELMCKDPSTRKFISGSKIFSRAAAEAITSTRRYEAHQFNQMLSDEMRAMGGLSFYCDFVKCVPLGTDLHETSVFIPHSIMPQWVHGAYIAKMEHFGLDTSNSEEMRYVAAMLGEHPGFAPAVAVCLQLVNKDKNCAVYIGALAFGEKEGQTPPELYDYEYPSDSKTKASFGAPPPPV